MSLGCLQDDALNDDLAAGGVGARAAAGGAATGGSATGGTRSSGVGGGTTPAGSGGAGGSAGEPQPGSGESGVFVGMTAAHNAARALLDEGLADLTWSPEIAAFSQQWSDSLAQECGMIAHRDQRRYGENIAMRGSTRVDRPFAPEAAVAGWVAEEACWDFGTIAGSERCDAACAQSLNSNGCGHYTQVIWRNTERVGCGYSTCQSQGYTFEIWVCNYDPPGNFIGQTPY